MKASGLALLWRNGLSALGEIFLSHSKRTMIMKHAVERAAIWCAVIVGIVLFAETMRAMMLRGPWYDEFYTLYVTRSGSSWRDLLFNHWLTDNHPPLFYALSRATNWLGETVEQRRWVNLAVFAIGAGGVFCLGRSGDGTARRTIALFVIGLCAVTPALQFGAELRSNYLAFVSATLANIALVSFVYPHAEPSRRQSLGLILALTLALNVHYAATVIIMAIAGAFGARLVLARDWRGMARLMACGIVASLPLIVTLALQLGRIENNTRSFWIPPGINAARWTIQNVVVATLSTNWPLTLSGGIGIAWQARADWRERRLSSRLGLCLTLGAGVGLAIVLLLAIQTWRPFVISRYLIALIPAVLLPLAIGSEAVLRRLDKRAGAALLLLIAVSTLVSIQQNFRATVKLPSWNGTSAAVAAYVHQCPGTLVHVDTTGNAAVLALAPPDNALVVPQAYRWMAARYGFALEPDQSRRMAMVCPTIFWTDHAAGQKFTLRERIISLRQQGFSIRSATMQTIDDGWLLITYPDR